MRVSLGIDAGGTFTKIVAVSERRLLLGEASIPTMENEGPRSFISRLSCAVKELEKSLGTRFRSVGAAIAGDVDSAAGRIRRSPNLESFERFPFRASLEKSLGAAVVVHNDANMAAWGAYSLELAEKFKNVAVISLGTGIGGGAVIDGRLLTGGTGSAMEVGHIRVVSPGGYPCGCGGTGHLEAHAGTKGILRTYGQTRASEPKDIFLAASRGERAALETWEKVGEALAVGVSNLVYLLNPDAVVFTGGIAKAGRFFLPAVRRAFAAESFRTPFGHAKLLFSKRSGLGAAGAALYALDNARSR